MAHKILKTSVLLILIMNLATTLAQHEYSGQTGYYPLQSSQYGGQKTYNPYQSTFQYSSQTNGPQTSYQPSPYTGSTEESGSSDSTSRTLGLLHGNRGGGILGGLLGGGGLLGNLFGHGGYRPPVSPVYPAHGSVFGYGGYPGGFGGAYPGGYGAYSPYGSLGGYYG